ncbi:sulfur carrier protein ThiS [Pseudonocardia sp. TMWB2A]|uniref:sulfur carrier protein ThiS n=1 Tax=Pseudonocardia sp. TMWB2A TaxID=687430 RepID=UPI00307F3B80
MSHDCTAQMAALCRTRSSPDRRPYREAVRICQRERKDLGKKMTALLDIIVNGEPRRVAEGLTLAGLAAELGLAPEKVAVERNREIVPRSTLADVALAAGDEIEIVHFVGGG